MSEVEVLIRAHLEKKMQGGQGLEALAALLSNELAEVGGQRMQPCMETHVSSHHASMQSAGTYTLSSTTVGAASTI